MTIPMRSYFIRKNWFLCLVAVHNLVSSFPNIKEKVSVDQNMISHNQLVDQKKKISYNQFIDNFLALRIIYTINHNYVYYY